MPYDSGAVLAATMQHVFQALSPVKASRESCRIHTYFNIEISELPTVAPPPLEKIKPFQIALKCQQCPSDRGESTSSIRCGAFETLGLAKYGQCSRVFLILRCELCQTTWPWVRGSVGLGPGRVVPGGTEFVVLDTVAVDGYFKLLKLSSERNHISLGSLAGILSRKWKAKVWETCNLFTDTLVRMQQLYNAICSSASDGKKQLSQVVGAGGQRAKDQRKKICCADCQTLLSLCSLCLDWNVFTFVFFFFSSNLEIILIYFKPSIKTSHAALPGWW